MRTALLNSAMEPATGFTPETAFFADGSYRVGFVCRLVGAFFFLGHQEKQNENIDHFSSRSSDT
jgi:hypothetical protein